MRISLENLRKETLFARSESINFSQAEDSENNYWYIVGLQFKYITN